MNNQMVAQNVQLCSNKVSDITESKQMANNAKNETETKHDCTVPSQSLDKKYDGFDKDPHQCECEACRSRRYADGSTDGGVSFKMPINVHPSLVKGEVRGHELEHVRRSQYEAKKDNKTIISQSVSIKHALCKECGAIYVKGGETRTTVRAVGADFYKVFSIGLDEKAENVNKK